MAISRALASLSKFLSKFFHDGLPVALASVIGAMLVGQFNRPSASPPIVVQPPPPPGGQTMAAVISDEHQLIVDYLKRDAEAKRAADLARGDASAQKRLAPAVEERPAKARLAAAEIAPSRSAAKPVPEKKAAARDPLRLVPALPEAAPLADETVGEIAEAGSPGVIGAVRGLVAHAAELPARLWSAVDRNARRCADASVAPAAPMAVNCACSL